VKGKKMVKSKLIGITLLVILMLLISSFQLLSNSRILVNAESQSANDDNLLQFEWPEFTGDSSFTRFSPGPAPSTSDILWKADVTNIQSYIAAFNGMVFVTTNSSVVALNRETGNVVWSAIVPMGIYNNQSNTNLQFQNGTWPVAYKLDETRMLVESTCLETNTGHILWTSTDFSADTGNFNSNVYSPEEKMFYIKMLSFVQAWDFSDLSEPPKLVWTTYVPGGGRIGSGVTYGDGKIFPGSFQDLQMAIDAKTGHVLWTTRTKTPMIFSGSYYQGKFLRGGSDDNTMYCFDANNGNILWTHNANSNGYFCSGTAAAYGILYATNKDGCIYAFNTNNGSLAWKYQGPGTMIFPGMPTVADGKVYVTSGQNASFGDETGASEFACLDAFTGKPIWKLPIEAFAPRESVAIAYGNLYLIPSDVTKAVDSITGSEYSTKGQIWAIGTTSPQLGNGSWPMFRHDPERSSIGQGGPSNLSLVWKFPTNGAVMSSPSVVDGVVYFGSQDKNIYAVNALSGTLIWNFTTLDAIESSPAIANGKVCTGGEDGYVYCLDAYNGNFLWKTFVNGSLPITFGAAVMLRSSPAIVDNKVYVGSLDGNLYVLDLNNGTIEWKFKTSGLITSSPTVAGGAVYIVSEEPVSGGLYKLNAETGDLIWKKSIPYELQFTGGTDMQGSPTVANGMVFASSNLRTYYGINAANGDTIWTFTNPLATEFIVSSPIYLNGELFIVNKFNITCLDASNAHTIWTVFTGDEFYVSPSYADNKLYVVTSERNLFIFSANNGEKLARYVLPAASWSSPTPYGGRIYVGDNDWNLYCFAEYNTVNSQLTIQLDKSTIALGGALAVSGQLSPAIANAEITLAFTKPDKTKDNVIVTANNDGTFSYAYTPDTIGSWSVTATCQSDTQKITSEASSFQVTAASTTNTITIQDYIYIIIIIIALILILTAAYAYKKLRTKHQTMGPPANPS
jgi:outer membrane protein assembly factor BamB